MKSPAPYSMEKTPYFSSWLRVQDGIHLVNVFSYPFYAARQPPESLNPQMPVWFSILSNDRGEKMFKQGVCVHLFDYSCGDQFPD